MGALAAVLLTRGGDTTTSTTTVATTVGSTVTVRSTTAATSTGSAPPRAGVVTVVRHVGPFTGVNLAGANVVHVRIGGSPSVTVTAERKVVPRVTTTVHAGVLVIAGRGRYTTHALHVEVTVPTLSSAALDGSGRLIVEGIRGPRFAASLGGSGVLRAAGQTDDLHAALGGVGNLELVGLAATRAQAALPGSGRMTLTVTRSLQASLSGNGSIVYGGSPGDVSTRVTGNGTITSR